TRSAPHSSLTPAPAHEGRSTSRPASLTSHSSTRAAVGVTRDSHGRIKRSESARLAFEHHHPCPSTGKTSGACPGYVVDHIVPLKRAWRRATGPATSTELHSVLAQILARSI